MKIVTTVTTTKNTTNEKDDDDRSYGILYLKGFKLERCCICLV